MTSLRYPFETPRRPLTGQIYMLIVLHTWEGHDWLIHVSHVMSFEVVLLFALTSTTSAIRIHRKLLISLYMPHAASGTQKSPDWPLRRNIRRKFKLSIQTDNPSIVVFDLL